MERGRLCVECRGGTREEVIVIGVCKWGGTAGGEEECNGGGWDTVVGDAASGIEVAVVAWVDARGGGVIVACGGDTGSTRGDETGGRF